MLVRVVVTCQSRDQSCNSPLATGDDGTIVRKDDTMTKESDHPPNIDQIGFHDDSLSTYYNGTN